MELSDADEMSYPANQAARRRLLGLGIDVASVEGYKNDHWSTLAKQADLARNGFPVQVGWGKSDPAETSYLSRLD